MLTESWDLQLGDLGIARSTVQTKDVRTLIGIFFAFSASFTRLSGCVHEELCFSEESGTSGHIYLFFLIVASVTQ